MATMHAADSHDRLNRLLTQLDTQRRLVVKTPATAAGEPTRYAVGQFSLELAELLLQRGADDDATLAAGLIDAVLAEQRLDAGPDRGRFPMMVPEPWRDLNGTLFLLPYLVALARDYAGALPGALTARLEQAIRLSVGVVKARWESEVFDVHRDFTCYSNIFVLYVQALVLLGEHLDDADLREIAQGQWRRWFNHTSSYGIDEFVSTNYNHVIFKALCRIKAASAGRPMHDEAAMVLEHLVALQSALHHPALGLPICGVSRDYRLFLEPGRGGFAPLAHGQADEHASASVLSEYRNRLYPHRAGGWAGTRPFRFACWQSDRCGLGSMTGGHYFPHHLHLLAAAGHSPTERAVAFMGGDGSNAISGFVRQADHRALCLFARAATAYFHTQLQLTPTGLPVPRTKPVSLALTDAWQLESAAGADLCFSAFGHRLCVHGFAIEDGQVREMHWSAERITVNKVELQAWRADPRFTLVGCVVEVLGPGAPPTDRPVVMAEAVDRRLDLRERGGLGLAVSVLPSGEYVEHYPDDWRATPLFSSPAHTLWPGEMAHRTARPE